MSDEIVICGKCRAGDVQRRDKNGDKLGLVGATELQALTECLRERLRK